jgi:VIT1/CCC1 family predicted Fe2+/Mn2+ transporter
MSKRPLFLARQSYRARRIGDAARLLPVAAAVLFLAPVLFAPGARTSSTMTFILVVWALLIVGAFVLSRALRGEADEEE